MYWSEQGNTHMIFRASMDGSNTEVMVNDSVCDIPNHLYLDIKGDK